MFVDDGTRGLIFFAIVLAVLLAVGVMAFISATENKPPDGAHTGCTNDTKVCPDNSTVGRILPRCDFQPC